MKKILILFFFTFQLIYAQSFEGIVSYDVLVKSKGEDTPNQMMSNMMGTKWTYYYKGQNYRTTTNGVLVKEQIYDPLKQKLFTLMSNEWLWNDVTVLSNPVLSWQITENAMEVFGLPCNELYMETQSGIHRYYYNATYTLPKSGFENHHYGNWSDFISKTGALPLKSITESNGFIFEVTVTEIDTTTALSDSIFFLPQNVKVRKSPY